MEVAERATVGLHIVTDSKYAMDMAMEIKTGGKIPEGTHKKLWTRFKDHAHKVLTITKIKSHLEWEEAEEMGFSRRDWIGNKKADEQAGKGADMHGYTADEIKQANKHTELVTKVQQHMVSTYIRMLKHPMVVLDRRNQKVAAEAKKKKATTKWVGL